MGKYVLDEATMNQLKGFVSPFQGFAISNEP